MRLTCDDAVSPVVGVMLMLVVTIIIAAVVSGFAGSLGSDSEKPASVSLIAKYSQTDGLVFTHGGGDALTVIDVKVVFRPSTQFARYADQWADIIPNIKIKDKDGQYWVEEVFAFTPGDTAYVSADVFTDLQVGKVASSSTNSQLINHPDNVGKTITLELYSSKTNRLIAKSDITVEA